MRISKVRFITESKIDGKTALFMPETRRTNTMSVIQYNEMRIFRFL